MKTKSHFYGWWCIGVLIACVIINILAAESAWARFCTIAGGCEPNAIGQLLITYVGPKERQEVEFAVFYTGVGPETEATDIVLSGRTGNIVDLVTGIYDVKVLVRPVIWMRKVAIEKGKTTTLDVGGYGRILIAGTDSTGKPLGKSFYMYAPDDRKNVVTSGTTNEPMDVQAGIYDIQVNLVPAVWFEAVEVVAGQSKVIDLLLVGRLEVRGKDALGQALFAKRFYVYARGKRDESIASGFVNQALDLPPGVYDIQVDLRPAVWFEAVEVVAGQSKVIDLLLVGRLEVRGKDALGQALFAKGFYVYARGKRDESIASGFVNQVLDLPPGVYDIQVDLRPTVWYEAVEVTAGQSRVIDLPQRGRFKPMVLDSKGNLIAKTVYIYHSRQDSNPVAVTHSTKYEDLPPGEYVIRFDLYPEDVWVENIKIKAGEVYEHKLKLEGK